MWYPLAFRHVAYQVPFYIFVLLHLVFTFPVAAQVAKAAWVALLAAADDSGSSGSNSGGGDGGAAPVVSGAIGAAAGSAPFSLWGRFRFTPSLAVASLVRLTLTRLQSGGGGGGSPPVKQLPPGHPRWMRSFAEDNQQVVRLLERVSALAVPDGAAGGAEGGGGRRRWNVTGTGPISAQEIWGSPSCMFFLFGSLYFACSAALQVARVLHHVLSVAAVRSARLAGRGFSRLRLRRRHGGGGWLRSTPTVTASEDDDAAGATSPSAAPLAVPAEYKRPTVTFTSLGHLTRVLCGGNGIDALLRLAFACVELFWLFGFTGHSFVPTVDVPPPAEQQAAAASGLSGWMQLLWGGFISPRRAAGVGGSAGAGAGLAATFLTSSDLQVLLVSALLALGGPAPVLGPAVAARVQAIAGPALRVLEGVLVLVALLDVTRLFHAAVGVRPMTVADGWERCPLCGECWWWEQPANRPHYCRLLWGRSRRRRHRHRRRHTWAALLARAALWPVRWWRRHRPAAPRGEDGAAALASSGRFRRSPSRSRLSLAPAATNINGLPSRPGNVFGVPDSWWSKYTYSFLSPVLSVSVSSPYNTFTCVPERRPRAATAAAASPAAAGSSDEEAAAAAAAAAVASGGGSDGQHATKNAEKTWRQQLEVVNRLPPLPPDLLTQSAVSEPAWQIYDWYQDQLAPPAEEEEEEGGCEAAERHVPASLLELAPFPVERGVLEVIFLAVTRPLRRLAACLMCFFYLPRSSACSPGAPAAETLASSPASLFRMFLEHPAGRQYTYVCIPLKFATDMLSVVAPLMVKQLVVFLQRVAAAEVEGPNRLGFRRSLLQGLLICAGLVAVSLGQTLTFQAYLTNLNAASLKASAALKTIILRHALETPLACQGAAGGRRATAAASSSSRADRSAKDTKKRAGGGGGGTGGDGGAGADVLTLLTVDAASCGESLIFLHNAWAHPIVITVALATMNTYVGWFSTLSAFATMILLLPLNKQSSGGKADKKRKREKGKSSGTDEKGPSDAASESGGKSTAAALEQASSLRISDLTAALTSMRTVKAMALEWCLMRRVARSRERESHAMRDKNGGAAVAGVMTEMTTLIVSLVCCATYLLGGGGMNAAVLVPAFAALSVVRFPILDLPVLFSQIDQGHRALQRISAFLRRRSAPRPRSTPGHRVGETAPGELWCAHTTFAWEAVSEEEEEEEEQEGEETQKKRDDDDSAAAGERRRPAPIALRDIHMHVRPGEFVVIRGPTASGKSALLQAMLHELWPLPAAETAEEAADAKDPSRSASASSSSSLGFSVGGSVAYCAEVPWLRNRALRQNITLDDAVIPPAAADDDGGARQRWYRAVVEACGLARDIASMADGDETVVGEDGSKLSGGQKARVGLARAVYHKRCTDVFLIDDVLAPLDVEMQKHIIGNVIHGILRYESDSDDDDGDEKREKEREKEVVGDGEATTPTLQSLETPLRGRRERRRVAKKTVVLCSHVPVETLLPDRVFDMAADGSLREAPVRPPSEDDIVRLKSSWLEASVRRQSRLADSRGGTSAGAGGFAFLLPASPSFAPQEGSPMPQPLPQQASNLPGLLPVASNPEVPYLGSPRSQSSVAPDLLLSYRSRMHYSTAGSMSGSETGSGASSPRLRPATAAVMVPPAELAQMPLLRRVALLCGCSDELYTFLELVGMRQVCYMLLASVTMMMFRTLLDNWLGVWISLCVAAGGTACTVDSGAAPPRAETAAVGAANHGVMGWALDYLRNGTLKLVGGAPGQVADDTALGRVFGVVQHMLGDASTMAAASFLLSNALVGVLVSVLSYLRIKYFFALYGRVADVMQMNVVRRLFAAPVSFFDRVSSSSIISVLSRDQAVVDTTLGTNLQLIYLTVLQLLALVVYNSLQYRAFAAIVPLAALLFYHLTARFLRLTRQVRSLEASVQGRAAAVAKEAVRGAVTVRAYDGGEGGAVAQALLSETCGALDAALMATNVGTMAERWVALRLDAVALLLTVALALLAVFWSCMDMLRRRHYGRLGSNDSGSTSTAAVAGMGVVACLRASKALSLLCRRLGLFQSQFVSAEQLIHLWRETPVEPGETEAPADALLAEDKDGGGSQLAPSYADDGAAPRATALRSLLDVVHVRARYQFALPYVLHDVTFQLRPGECVGVIGRTGNGKSSVFNALLQLMDVVEGGIFVPASVLPAAVRPYDSDSDDSRVRDLQDDDDDDTAGGGGSGGTMVNALQLPAKRFLRSQYFQLVSQDPLLLQGTVRSNLLLGAEAAGIPDERLWEVLCRVALDDLADATGAASPRAAAVAVPPLPSAASSALSPESRRAAVLDFPVKAGGANLSAGQRQLLCLARTLLHRPRVVLLDEVSSRVDHRTDALIHDIIQEQILRRGSRQEGEGAAADGTSPNDPLRRLPPDTPAATVKRGAGSSDCAVLLIAHRLETLLSLCDRVLVIERGRCVAELATAELHGVEDLQEYL